ncbi:hypothetical protein [Saccharopolyspora hattusasensis]|uniref:hypothetical protein n=1 Tax=Saccharopolyspora hattusasensis TaxID=1128679 RepID=UPI003D9527C2
MEKRLARGHQLLEAGRDPRRHGWLELPNLIWATRHGLVDSQTLNENLPLHPNWPSELREFAQSTGVWPGIGLMCCLHQMLFPREIDLQPFRVLLLLGMTDCTSEELHALQVPDLEFSAEGVRIVQAKQRTESIRADFSPGRHHRQDARGARRQVVSGPRSVGCPRTAAAPGRSQRTHSRGVRLRTMAVHRSRVPEKGAHGRRGRHVPGPWAALHPLARQIALGLQLKHAARRALANRTTLALPGEAQRDEMIADLRRKLREASTRATELRGKLDALATVTANLYYENLELKKKSSANAERRIAALPASCPWLE